MVAEITANRLRLQHERGRMLIVIRQPLQVSLGTMLGYKKVPAYWKQGLKEVEDIDFKYTTMSLNKVYEIGVKHALENIQRNGGTVDAMMFTSNHSHPRL
jgi:hypothetical protein